MSTYSFRFETDDMVCEIDIEEVHLGLKLGGINKCFANFLGHYVDVTDQVRLNSLLIRKIEDEAVKAYQANQEW